jgi:hypothetical protein
MRLTIDAATVVRIVVIALGSPITARGIAS